MIAVAHTFANELVIAGVAGVLGAFIAACILERRAAKRRRPSPPRRVRL